MGNNNSILYKVNFLFRKALSKEYSEDDLSYIITLCDEHSENMVLGKVFGYSVSDYAFATLKWIGSDECISIFKKHFYKLPKDRQTNINNLIESKLYNQY